MVKRPIKIRTGDKSRFSGMELDHALAELLRDGLLAVVGKDKDGNDIYDLTTKGHLYYLETFLRGHE